MTSGKGDAGEMIVANCLVSYDISNQEVFVPAEFSRETSK
jgi:hypothetical protein